MRFTKFQKNIIKKIASGEIQDIYTFLKSFNLISFEQYDRTNIEKAFIKDDIPKEYYFPENLIPKFSNIESSKSFTTKSNSGDIDPNKYDNFSLKLNYKSGIKQLQWDNIVYDLNFYEGIHIAHSFDDIKSFLTIWQYLKSEMLILDLPSAITSQTLGLFYEKQKQSYSYPSLTLKERIKQIDFTDCTYDDNNYFNGIEYIFSYEHCEICKEYLGRKIYPTPELNTFIQRNFKTTEEKTQGSALLAAWLAIFVAIILPIIPNFQKNNSEYLTEIISEINDLETHLINHASTSNYYNEEIKTNLEEIKYKLEISASSDDLSDISKQLNNILEKLKE